MLNRKTFIVLAVALGAGGTAARAQTPADVAFMQGMITHHAQAVVMARLVPARSTWRDFAMMAERILVSQRDEIAFMRRWLQEHHAAVPMLDVMDDHAAMHHADSAMHHADSAMHHADSAMHHATMPGMLTPDQMQRLAASKGAEFEQLFLTGMIQHHRGALVMVRDLFAIPGAGQDPLIFRFASDIDTDQRAEIARMQTLLQALR